MGSLQIPESSSTIEIAIIDTTAKLLGIPTPYFFGPTLEGFEKFTCCAYAFLVTHKDATTGKQRRIIFDLGPPKDWQHDLAPHLVKAVESWNADLTISKYVSEILEENNVPPASIEAAVWSHAHWDHTGRMSLFPSNVDLITGPGVKAEHYPGYPTVQTSPILERDFANRTVTELDFSTSNLTIGAFKAIDYFNDGSFYFLSAPGHATGHVNALARTTSPSSSSSSSNQTSTTAKSTFILMGADSFHHSSQVRPSKEIPLPDEIPGPIPHFAQYTSMCPGHIFDAVHPCSSHRKQSIPAHYAADISENHNDAKITPYFTISSNPEGKSIAIDLAAAKETIKGLQKFDGDENVLLVAAHDQSLYDVLEYFPRNANEWKSKGWKEKGRWRFLGDLKEAVEISQK